MRYIFMVVAFLALVLGIGWFGLVTNRPMAKYAEETRRQVFTESQTYQEGMAQNLDTLCREWDKTKSPGVADSIRQRSSGYSGPLPSHIQFCIDNVRGL